MNENPEPDATRPQDAEPDVTPSQPDASPSEPYASPTQETPDKDPSEWVTGDEPMTGPQASYLQTLCRQAGVDFDASLSKAAASKLIDELQERTGRGR